MIPTILKRHKQVYDTLAPEYEKNIPNYLEPTKEAVEILSTKLSKNAEVLDVGCGVGVATKLLVEKGYSVTSMDISPKMIDFVKNKNPKGKCIVGDFSSYHFDSKYDAVIGLAFIHLFPKQTAIEILHKMHTILKSSGYLYLGTTESTESKEGWELKRDAFFPNNTEKRYRKHWTEPELKDSLATCGFSVEKVIRLKDLRGKMWMDFLASAND